MTKFGDNALTYDARGRLIKFGNTTLTYDNGGNRLSKGSTNYAWTRGRLLQSVGSTSFTYDKDGIRATKTTSDGIISYVYNNGKLLAEIRGGEIIYYFYNATGICGARYKGADYVYEKNVFGDVIAVIKNGTDVAQYNYDAWGNVEEVYVNNNDDFAPINPIRYRGYYYDTETGLYYLLTRYYDPTIGQFINPDTPDYLEPETIDGVNLYAYCGNMPTRYIDPTGHIAIGIILLGIGVSALISGLWAGANASEGESFGAAFLGGVINGLISSAALAAGLAFGGIIGGAIAVGGGFIGGFLGNVVTQAISYGDVDTNVAIFAGTISAGLNLLMYVSLFNNQLFSTAGDFLARFLENFGFDIIVTTLSFFITSIPIPNPNDLRGKF